MQTIVFPFISRIVFTIQLIVSGVWLISPYTSSPEDANKIAEKVAGFLAFALSLSRSQVTKEIQNLIQQSQAGKLETVLLIDCPCDFWLPATPNHPDVTTPPAKVTFISEWFVAGMQWALGFYLWSDASLYNGMLFHPVSSRSGKEEQEQSIGSARMGFHIGFPFADPPKLVTLYCERPAMEGGELYFVNSVTAIKSLSQEDLAILSQPLFDFKVIAGKGVYQATDDSVMLPIIVKDNQGEIVLVRVRRPERLGYATPEEEAVYARFYDAINAAERNLVRWKRGMVAFSYNWKWTHTRKSFTNYKKRGRWLFRTYGKRRF